MKNKRLLCGILWMNVILAGMLLGLLLLYRSDRIMHRSLKNDTETVTEKSDLTGDPGYKEKVVEENTPVVVPDAGDEIKSDTAELQEPVLESETDEQVQKRAWIENKIAAMTIEEKVAQLFVLSPEKLTGVGHVVAAGETTKKAINDFPIGGMVYFGANIETPQQITEMLANTQSFSMERTGIPMFLAVDEEGGYVTRIAKNSNFDVPTYPYASEMGQNKDVSMAYEMGSEIGRYLQAYGFNVDFAPVADVLSNQENQVVKKRSFGSDPQLVSDMVLAELDGLESQNIIGCVKHFPGHGATVGDTHEGYAYTEKTWDELLECEIIPFSNSIQKDVSMIMVGHISLPNVVGDHTPASMSECMITEHLRNELGYEGIVITDALGMGAVSNSYSSKQAAISVLKAGGDMLLDPVDFKAAYEGILSEIASGGITEARINESIYRILDVKYELLKNNE